MIWDFILWVLTGWVFGIETYCQKEPNPSSPENDKRLELYSSRGWW